MSNFVGEDVGFGKFSGGAEAVLQFVVEAEIDVDLFVLGTVERTGGGLRRAAGGTVGVAEQDQLGVAVGNALLRQDLAPGVLSVVQDERDEVDQGLFLRVAGGIGLRHRAAARVHGAVPYQRQEITFENQAENKQDDDTAQTEMDASGAEAASATFVAAIFNVVAAS